MHGVSLGRMVAGIVILRGFSGAAGTHEDPLRPPVVDLGSTIGPVFKQHFFPIPRKIPSIHSVGFSIRERKFDKRCSKPRMVLSQLWIG